MLLKRDENNMVVGLTYQYNEDGETINWRKMVDPKDLVVNRQNKEELEKKLKKPFDQIQVSEVEDRHLLILLRGIKKLAKIRGYTAAIPTVNASTPTHASVTMNITWIPNKEDPVSVTEGDTASANLMNTESFAQLYLDSIAKNRAYVRAVRTFLGIEIVGKDEVGPSNEPIRKRGDSVPADDEVNQPAEENATVEETVTAEAQSATDTSKPVNTSYLEDLVKKKGMTFEQFRTRVLDKHSKKIKSDANAWTGFESLTDRDVFVLTGLLQGTKLEPVTA